MSTAPGEGTSGAAGERPPSVDALARAIADVDLPAPLRVDAARHAVTAEAPGDGTTFEDRARARAQAVGRALLRPVVNATGVLLHTNLGRAPLANDQAASATNLELDLTTGSRGSRHHHAGGLLARAAGAEAGLVVNNGAAACLVVLAALGAGRGVAVSRGEMVEIGGGFRIPDVLDQSGARLVEVGTTNRTRIGDYERAVADPAADVALLLKVHQSNYRVTGFTESTSVAELSGLDRTVVVDLGSGLLDTACGWLPGGPPEWLAGEPAVRQTVAAGADLVVFSGDKLLGGPQAGIIVGRRDLVDRCSRHPLTRAVRPGGLVLAALQDVALAYLDGRAGTLPFWEMAVRSVVDLRTRADTVVAGAGVGASVACASVAGGGTLPGVEIPSWGVALDGDRCAFLREADPPVIGRVHEGRTILDLRTVHPGHDSHLVTALRSGDSLSPLR